MGCDDDTGDDDEGGEEMTGAHGGRVPDAEPCVTDPAAGDVGAC